MPLTNPQVLTSTFTAIQGRLIEPRDGEHEIFRANETVEKAVSASQALQKAVAKVEANEDLAPAGKARQNAKLLHLHFDPVLESLKESRGRIKTRAETVSTASRELPEPTAEQKALAPEIRAHFKSLSHDERIKEMEKAKRELDVLTLRALIDGPSYLTGLPENLIGLIRESLAQQLHPTARATRERLDTTKQILEVMESQLSRTLKEYDAASPEPVAA